jgi:acyl-CoA reductase-like NAD-dependent aldehyde dehydrogenase
MIGAADPVRRNNYGLGMDNETSRDTPGIGHRQMFIGGAWVDALDGGRFVTVNPATGAEIGSVPRGRAADVDRAVAAARNAFDSGRWGQSVAERDRARVLFRMADLVRERRDDLARLEVLDCGKPIGDAEADIDEVAFMFEYYAGWATKIMGDIPPVGPDAMSLVVKEPVGVCGLIVPWNYPMLMAAQKVAPALAAGCTVVLKPAEQTPLSALVMAEIAAEAGVPDGVFNVVTGVGVEAGEPMLTDPRVDKISFTGSLAVGRHIQRTCADDLKRVTLELGGKSPNIVFADAPMPEAVSGSCLGVFGNQGEVCSAGSRVLVQRSIHDEFVAAMVAETEAIRLGSGLDRSVTMGPLVSAAQMERVNGFIDSAPADGARLVHAGRRPDDPVLAGGFFVPPMIFAVDDQRPRIAREEIFGPVMTVIPFDDEAEAIRLAHDTEYGLAAAIWTTDISRAMRTARALRAGVVWVNDSQPAPSEAMWGGYKQSGVGRELGPYALDAYLESKQIYINLGG